MTGLFKAYGGIETSLIEAYTGRLVLAAQFPVDEIWIKAWSTAFGSAVTVAWTKDGFFEILYGGNINLIDDKMIRLSNETTGAAANASNRGKLRMVQGGAGVADLLYCCMKSILDTYSWVLVATG
jgi:hypothetical protein